MKSKALAVGAGVVAIVAGIVLLRQPDPEPSQFIYLLDARSDASEPLEHALPVIHQLEQAYDAKVIVRAAASLNPLRDKRLMFEEFERRQELSETSPMFFRLDRPYETTKKTLRSSIDDQSTLQGTSRIALLRNLIIVRDTERLHEPDACRQLDEDVSYAEWNFLGIGLIVHEGTLEGLRTCIDALSLPRDA